MKKQITAFTALTLAAALLVGCSEKKNNLTPAEGNNSTSTVVSSSDGSESTTSTESTVNEPISVPDYSEHGRFVYGEKEIPDITYPEYDETTGRYIAPMAEGKNHGLESMVFETHTFGDYTVKLVGNYVRTDKEHFPGTIYVQGLYVEIEKDGKILNDSFGCSGSSYSAMYNVLETREILIYEDQIGNYLDIYELKNPIIAMRYFGRDDMEEPFRKIVDFTWIEDNMFVDGFLGKFAENTGVMGVGGGPLKFSSFGHYAVFAADKFKIENENTLVDEDAGIRYIFDFDKTDDSGHYYSTERI